MLQFLSMLPKKFSLKRKEGQGLVEYALILVLIAIVVIVALTFLGGTVDNIFNQVGTNLSNA